MIKNEKIFKVSKKSLTKLLMLRNILRIFKILSIVVTKRITLSYPKKKNYSF